jgi:hypothetical protein
VHGGGGNINHRSRRKHTQGMAPNSRNNGSVQIIGAQFWEEPVDDPEWDGNKEAEDVGPRDPLVTFPIREEFVGKTSPGNGLRVVLLWLLAGPNVCPMHGQQNFALVIDYRVHHD